MRNSKKVILRTKSIKNKVEKETRPFIKRLAEKEYVEGIVLLGGLGKRNFIDRYSDIDIAIFYKSDTPSKFYLPFEFRLKLNGIRYEFNIRQLFYDEQKSNEWDEGTKEAYSTAKVVVDKKKRIEKLIKRKTVFDEKVGYNRLLWVIQQYIWRGTIHSLRMYHRGYPEGSHELLNECVELLIEAIYIINKRYRGHTKWRVAMLTTMDILPTKFFDNLREAMKVNNFSLSSINRRIKYLNEIYIEILETAKKLYPEIPKDTYRYYYRNFYQLIKKTFSQAVVERYKNSLSEEENEQLEGLLCFNLVSSSSEVSKYIRTKNGANKTMVELNKKV